MSEAVGMISIRDAEVFHGHGAQRHHAVRGVGFDVKPGEMFGLVGGSGSGKSTLLRVLAGLHTQFSGTFRIAGYELTPWHKPSRTFHRHVQMVFQDPYAALNPRHTVDRSIAEGLVLHRFSDIDARVNAVLDQVGLGKAFRFRYPHELSGGQRQRVAIARAVALEPDILLLDEPTSALDASVQAEILNLLEEIRRSRGLTAVLVSHDLGVVAHLCDRIAVMQRGALVDQLQAQDLVAGRGHHPYTESLIAAAAH